jgi:uncharacterized protein YceK
MSTIRTALRTSALAVLTLTVFASLSGCAVVAAYTADSPRAVYPTWDAAKHSGDPVVHAANFVPHDATDLRVASTEDGRSAVLSFTPSDSIELTGCSPSPISGHPSVTSTWWPDKESESGWICTSGWHVFEQDGTVFGWVG